ncbi:MAG: SgcJ/EcaC family oxidoreductase [Pseudomonadales bacterium]|nr:SgcJ/EcaC family oxidoreductase [Pseudomonadales bacterium]
MTPTELILEFNQAWASLDAGKIAAYFTEDGIYHNMPSDPVQGRDNIEKFIAAFAANWTRTEFEILNITAHGSLVFAERIDRTMVGDKAVNLPCVGVYETEDNKIRVWRDYFDLGTYIKAVS